LAALATRVANPASLLPTNVVQMQFAMGRKFWRRGPWAVTVSVLFLLYPVSLATAQQAVVRDLCSSAKRIYVVPPIPATIASTLAPHSTEPTPAPIAPNPSPEVSVEPEVETDSAKPTPAPPILVEPTEIAKIARCVHASPIGVRYNPELTAKVRRQYEDELIYAKGATNEKVVSNVVLNTSVDITTPPPISYFGNFNQNDGPVFISLTGEITNNNPFPLSSVIIRCEYKDAHNVPQAFDFPFLYTLGAGSYVPYQNKVINALPPHSVVSDISCKVATAEIWQSADVIQYLNAPLNPDLGLSSRPHQ
jgi:hypothetical protein